MNALNKHRSVTAHTNADSQENKKERLAPTGTMLGYPNGSFDALAPTLFEASEASPASEAPESSGISEPRPDSSPSFEPDAILPRRSHPLALKRTLSPKLLGLGAPYDMAGASRFELIGQLGAGAMGEVRLVKDHDIGRPVAVKALRAGLEQGTALARFIEEVRTIGNLEHPNIAPIHDVGIDEQGRPYFLMKYVEGEDLSVIIDKLRDGDPDYQRRYTMEQRVQVFLGVLRALEFAHSRGVIHRDVKPENIMVGRHGEVTLMDWGIAKRFRRDPTVEAKASLQRHGQPESERETKATGPEESRTSGMTRSESEPEEERLSATEHGQVVGTPLYMAPEQLRGDPDALDQRSDLYSATVVFHEFLTLDHYMNHVRTMDELFHDILHVGWRNPLMAWHRSTQRPMPPMELFHFVRKGLQRDPDRRFQSAQEMIDRLEGLLEGKVPVQCHITLVKSTVRRLGRLVDSHPWLSFLGFATLTGSAIAGVVNLFL